MSETSTNSTNSDTNPDVDDDEPLTVSLTTNACTDELWRRWQYLGDLVEQAGTHMNDTGRRWKDSTDPVARAHLWASYEAEAREFRVLASWKDIFYAAFIFSTDGPFCAAFDDSPPPY